MVGFLLIKLDNDLKLDVRDGSRFQGCKIAGAASRIMSQKLLIEPKFTHLFSINNLIKSSLTRIVPVKSVESDAVKSVYEK